MGDNAELREGIEQRIGDRLPLFENDIVAWDHLKIWWSYETDHRLKQALDQAGVRKVEKNIGPRSDRRKVRVWVCRNVQKYMPMAPEKLLIAKVESGWVTHESPLWAKRCDSPLKPWRGGFFEQMRRFTWRPYFERQETLTGCCLNPQKEQAECRA